MPSPVALEWLPTDPDAASAATRAIAFLLIMTLAFLAAVGFRGMVGRVRRRSGGATRRLLGRPPVHEPWATGEWACGRCHTVNRASSAACERCRGPRAEVAMSFAAVVTEPDILPASIPAGAGATVTLEHNPAAHTQGLNGHWRLRVNSVIVGSAARRDGALALLRAVEGAEAVLYDPSGEGYAAYALPALVAAFEAPRLPLSTSCPEGRL
jgi:hypothetical protein